MRFESDNERWPGYIETSSYMSFPMLLAWEEAIGRTPVDDAKAGKITMTELYKNLLPVAISFVTKWQIVGLNVDKDGNPIFTAEGKPLTVDYCNFPASSRLVSWVIGCISDLYTRTNQTDPN